MGAASPRAWRAAVLSLVVVSLVVVLHRGQSSVPAGEFAAVRARSQGLLDTSVFDEPLFPEFQDAPAKSAAEESDEALGGVHDEPAAEPLPRQHISLELVTSSPERAVVEAPPQQISIELVTPPPNPTVHETGGAAGAQQSKPMQISIELSPAQAKAEGSLGALVGEPAPLDLPIVTAFSSVPTLPVEAPKPTSAVLSPLTIPIKITTTQATDAPLAAPLTEAPVPKNTSTPLSSSSSSSSPSPSTLNPLIAHYKKEEAHWKMEEAHWQRFEKHMVKMEAAHETKPKISTAAPTASPTKTKCEDCDMLHNQLNDLKKQYTMNQMKISTQKTLMQKAHFVQRLQRLERAVAQQQVHIMWQKKQLDQVNTLESVMPALVHGTKPLWGPGSDEAADESASASSGGGTLGNEKHKISQRLLKVERVLNSIMAKNGEAEVGDHLGISELHP